MRQAPEAELLGLCLGLAPDPVRLARARSLMAGPLDWDLLATRAAQARLMPLLHWHALPWPAALASRLRAAYAASAARALGQADLERRLLEAFRPAGVRAVLLKGAALRRHLYPDPALRPMTDIDLWIHPADLDVADAVLEGLGLVRQARGEAWTALRRFGCETAYADREGRLAVELHGSLSQYERYRGLFEVASDRLWASSRPDPLDPAARLMPLDLEPIYLAFHAGAVHGFRGTLWILDLHAWLGKYGAALDWPAVLEEARALGALRAFAWAARLAERACGRVLPPAVSRRLSRHLGGERLLEPGLGGPFCGQWEYGVPTGAARLQPLIALDGWGCRARVLGRGLMPSRELRRYRAAVASA